MARVVCFPVLTGAQARRLRRLDWAVRWGLSSRSEQSLLLAGALLHAAQSPGPRWDARLLAIRPVGDEGGIEAARQMVASAGIAEGALAGLSQFEAGNDHWCLFLLRELEPREDGTTPRLLLLETVDGFGPTDPRSLAACKSAPTGLGALSASGFEVDLGGMGLVPEVSGTTSR
jgi:hypothetical protein